MNLRQKDMLTFINATDDLADSINQKANELFILLKNFDVSKFDISDEFRSYFINHHLGARLFFSIQNSAHILHQSVLRTGKTVSEINIVDYGAGLGTLFMLAGTLNFKRVIYNDYLPNWKNTAKAICEKLNINIDDYITGDIDEVIDYAESYSFKYDIIASRNVIEHIYSLSRFYSLLYQHNKKAIVFSTTTANYHNPAMRFRHYWVHTKTEKVAYLPQRKKAIQEEWPSINKRQLNKLAKKTRGKAKEDFLKAISDYQQNKKIEPVPYLRSNTCEHITGYWCEHLLTRNEYQHIIIQAGFQIKYTAGFWDTHYKSGLMNIIAKIFNKLIFMLGKKGYILSPFINVVAYN